MIEQSSEQFKVATKIKELFQNRFDLLVNVDKEEHFIGTMFPDIVFLDKKTKLPLFIIEIKKNGRIATCMQQWKSQPKIPATLYVIVPQSELQNAKSIAAVTGLNTRFGYYTLTANGDVLNVIFE
jgi:hypothetical protein